MYIGFMKNTMTATANQIGIPYYLSFDGSGKFKPGRGEAGYTVAHVPEDGVRAFLAALPRESWMPGTLRLADEYGVCSCSGVGFHSSNCVLVRS